MPKCKKFEAQAIDYAYELLPEAEAVTFERHLKKCADCTEEVKTLTTVLSLTDEALLEMPLPERALQDIEISVYKRLAATPSSRSLFRSWGAILTEMWHGHRTAAVGSLVTAFIAIAVFVGNPFPSKTRVQLAEVQSADVRIEQYRQQDIQRSLEEALITHHLRNDAWATASQFQRMKEQAQGTNWVQVANTHLQNLPSTVEGY